MTRTAAQSASCLKAADFEKAFYIVQAAIGGDRKRGAVELSYESLLVKYKIPMSSSRLVPWMKKTEQSLLMINEKFDIEASDVKGAIFLWVCSSIKVSYLSFRFLWKVVQRVTGQENYTAEKLRGGQQNPIEITAHDIRHPHRFLYNVEDTTIRGHET